MVRGLVLTYTDDASVYVLFGSSSSVAGSTAACSEKVSVSVAAGCRSVALGHSSVVCPVEGSLASTVGSPKLVGRVLPGT